MVYLSVNAHAGAVPVDLPAAAGRPAGRAGRPARRCSVARRRTTGTGRRPSPGWTVRHQVRHLAHGEELGRLAATDPEAFARGARRGCSADLDAVEAATTAPSDETADGAAGALVGRRRGAAGRGGGRDPATSRIGWVTGPMSRASFLTARVMETFAHGHDIAAAVGRERPRRPGAPARRPPRAWPPAASPSPTAACPCPRSRCGSSSPGPAGDVWTWGPTDAPDRGARPRPRLLPPRHPARRHRDDTDARGHRPARRAVARHRPVLRRPAAATVPHRRCVNGCYRSFTHGLRRQPRGGGLPGRGPGLARRQRQAEGRRRAAHHRDGRLPRRPRRRSPRPSAGRPRWPTPAGRPSTGPRPTAAATPPRSQSTVLFEELARYDVPDTLFAIGVAMIGPTLIAHGTDEQKDRYLQPMRRGEEIWCQLWSEPDAGSDLAVAGHPGRARRRRVRAQRPEGLDQRRPLLRLRPRHLPHRPDGAEAQGHLVLRRRPAHARASRSARCGRSPARPTSTRCSSTTCASPPPTSSATCTTAGPWPAPRS